MGLRRRKPMPRKDPSDRLCRPVSHWPEADRLAWAAAFEPRDPFELQSAAGHWSLATRRKNAAGYGRYLAWLDARGELDPEAPIATRVNRERLDAYLQDL